MTPIEQVVEGVLQGLLAPEGYVFFVIGLAFSLLLKWVINPTVKWSWLQMYKGVLFLSSIRFTSLDSKVERELEKLRKDHPKYKHEFDFERQGEVSLLTGNTILREPCQRGQEHRVALKLIASADKLNKLKSM